MTLLDGRDTQAIEQAAQHLAAGQLVAFATETVYGLGARADDDAAVARIFAAKGRPAQHPLIVHLAQAEDAESFARAPLGDAARRLMHAFWPGPLTVIVPRRGGVATAAAGGQDSIGLRLPAHPQARALLQAAARLGVRGVAAPSANRFGRISATTAAHVQQEFGPGLWVLDGGACPVGIESAIVDCTRAPAALLRPGALTRGQIEQVLGHPLAAADAASPRAPGTLVSHYAPRAPLRLFTGDELKSQLPALQAAVLAAQQGAATSNPAQPGSGLMGVYSRQSPPGGSGFLYRHMPADATRTAHDLFAVLRELDEAGVSAIWVERPPPAPEWDGVRDRLQRAAA